MPKESITGSNALVSLTNAVPKNVTRLAAVAATFTGLLGGVAFADPIKPSEMRNAWPKPEEVLFCEKEENKKLDKCRPVGRTMPTEANIIHREGAVVAPARRTRTITYGNSEQSTAEAPEPSSEAAPRPAAVAPVRRVTTRPKRTISGPGSSVQAVDVSVKTFNPKKEYSMEWLVHLCKGDGCNLNDGFSGFAQGKTWREFQNFLTQKGYGDCFNEVSADRVNVVGCTLEYMK
ncbi:hypothetical protein HOD30_03760 [Candidatus Peregrinibacteria bacterium]|nr:hypothetical protein [Candidatus Peregrinibacteria bacterium]MBT4632359.1 hypothetical protein [Candidatus Peregrinibacteria bacterium]